jgi:hemerythrin-like domain-containing protein
MSTRRSFVLSTTAVAAAGALTGAAGALARPASSSDVELPEELMREHGLLARVLLVYDEAVRRIDAREPIPLSALRDAASFVKSYIEEYHERVEEDFIYPRFERSGGFVTLVETLRAQHEAGRAITARIIGAVDEKSVRTDLVGYTTMMRAHSAREDTVLFPALHRTLSARDLRKLARVLLDRQRALFGDDGGALANARVSNIEERFNLNDLARATVRAR